MESERHSHDRESPEDESFERKFKRFLRQSEDRQVDLKRNIEAKRGIKKRKR
jgi:predicted RNA-binding protein with RPS1 domain